MSDYSSPPTNPFEAPTSDTSAAGEEFQPGSRGPMPTSVVVALIATGLLVLFSAIGGIGQLAEGNLPVTSALSFAVGLLIMAGIAKGHRLAHQWGRILVCIGAILYTIGGVFAALGVVMLANNPDLMGADVPPELADVDMTSMMYLGVAFIFAFVALLWTIFFALGTASARRYFRLICPNCGHKKVRGADFFFNRGKCKRCGAIW